MIELSMTPRCAKYLKAMRVNLDEKGMNEYWAAVCIAESFSDKALKKFGGFDFDKMPGADLLMRMEEFLATKGQSVPQVKKSPAYDYNPRPMDHDALSTITTAVSQEEIDACRSPKGGWKAAQLAKWGVPWPPPAGWRKQLISNYEHSITGSA